MLQILSPDWGSIIEVEYNDDLIDHQIDLDHDGEIEDQENESFSEISLFKQFKDKIFGKNSSPILRLSYSLVVHKFARIENHYCFLYPNSLDRPPQV